MGLQEQHRVKRARTVLTGLGHAVVHVVLGKQPLALVLAPPCREVDGAEALVVGNVWLEAILQQHPDALDGTVARRGVEWPVAAVVNGPHVVVEVWVHAEDVR